MPNPVTVKSRSKPKQLKLTVPAKQAGGATGLDNLEQARDLDGQQAQAAERYGASVGKKPKILKK